MFEFIKRFFSKNDTSTEMIKPETNIGEVFEFEIPFTTMNIGKIEGDKVLILFQMIVKYI